MHVIIEQQRNAQNIEQLPGSVVETTLPHLRTCNGSFFFNFSKIDIRYELSESIDQLTASSMKPISSSLASGRSVSAQGVSVVPAMTWSSHGSMNTTRPS